MAAQSKGPQIGLLSSVKADGSRVAIHPSDVKGRFINRRRLTFAVLIAIYVALPLIQVGGHPAIHLDVAARRFYLFGDTYNAQDFWLVLFLVTTAGFALLFATAGVGRVWCGWACPQTVFLEGVYRPIERWLDGPRERRLKLAGQPWTAGRVARAVLKHSLYILVSLLLSHVALSLFVSAGGLVGMVAAGPSEHTVAFAWAMCVAGLLYFNFAWFREQMCIVVCPYGRLQSAMHDEHSVIIGYDARRGEPRGRLTKDKPPEAPAPVSARKPVPTATPLDMLNATLASATQGDCVDCFRCVTACPTGIDIRNGFQMECLACAQCIDACDEVMDKVGKPRGLIRYDSMNGLAGQPKRFLRPRLVAYGVFLLASFAALWVNLARRIPFEANLLRFQGAPYVLEAGTVRNQFELHLVNKNPEDTTISLRVTSPVPAQVVLPQHEVKLGSLEDFRVPLFVTVDAGSRPWPFELSIQVTDQASGEVKHLQARFLGPQG